MSYQRPQKPTLTGQRFKTRKRGLYPPISLPSYTCTQTKSPYSWTWCAWSFFFLFPSPPDEKERFDPTQFQESIVHGLNQTGTDLDAVAKFLDASGAKLDYRRYAETLFDILVAGGMLGEARCLSANWFACVLIQQQHQQVEVRVSDAGLFFFSLCSPGWDFIWRHDSHWLLPLHGTRRPGDNASIRSGIQHVVTWRFGCFKRKWRQTLDLF